VAELGEIGDDRRAQRWCRWSVSRRKRANRERRCADAETDAGAECDDGEGENDDERGRVRIQVREVKCGVGGGWGGGGAESLGRGAEVGEEAAPNGGAVWRSATVVVVDGFLAPAGGGRGWGGHSDGRWCEEEWS
jgi:hypothetical protein